MIAKKALNVYNILRGGICRGSGSYIVAEAFITPYVFERDAGLKA
jgi:hypothetical protein